MKKILVLMGRYFPKASPNSICMQSIIDSLPKDEYEVDVLSYEDGYSCAYDGNVCKFSRGLLQSQLYKNESRTGRAAAVLNRVLTLLMKVKQLPFLLTWPWSDPLTTRREYRKAKRLHQSRHYDTVIAIHMPLSSLIVAHRLKKDDPSLTCVAYFLDALSGGYVPHGLSQEQYNRKAVKWEKKLLDNADRIVFMKSSKDYHEEVYRGSALHDRIVYLDLPLLRDLQGQSDDSQPLSIVYVGSLAPSMRSPAYFLKVFQEIDDPRLRLTFVGDANCEVLNQYAKKDARVTVVGRCSYEEAAAYERGAGVLLNIGNKNTNLTPSKIFEYMSFGKKIISTYTDERDTSLSYLKDYPACVVLDERDADFAKAADAVRQFLEVPADTVTYGELQTIFPENTPAAFIDLL